MGYGITNRLFYGHILDPDQSRKLVDCLGAFVSGNPGHPLAQACQEAETSPSDADFDAYTMYECLSDLMGSEMGMVPQDSDSRQHDSIYESGFHHGFGVIMAATGYGGDHSSKEKAAIMAAGPTDEHRQAYENAIADWVRFAGIGDEPIMVSVSNMS